jgi:DNA-binding MarR family transcriptional regulator
MRLRRAEERFNLATRDYARLAAFREALRGFLRFSELAAAKVGLTSQHYQAMLIVRASPGDQGPTIAELAGKLLIKHNSCVELVDRLVREDLVSRRASLADRRKVHLRLTEHGRAVLAKLVGTHRRELQRIGPTFKRFFTELSRHERAGSG